MWWVVKFKRHRSIAQVGGDTLKCLNHVMLQVARSLVIADRTGSWLVHVRPVSKCIPIFAAAGHYNYLTSSHFYVQQMGQLHINHPDVFRKFENGYHVIRSSNQFWAGLSSDLVIEQTLMRSLKTCGVFRVEVDCLMSKEPVGPCQLRYQHSTTLQCRSSPTCHTVHRNNIKI